MVVAGADLPDAHELDVVRTLAAEEDRPPVVAVLDLVEAAEHALLAGRGRGDAVAAAPARRNEPPHGRW